MTRVRERVELSDFKAVDKFKIFDHRVQSYVGWPNNVPVSIDELVRAGWFYTGSGDCVQCPWCHGRVHSWVVGDTGLGEHKRHFPSCTFVEDLLNKTFEPLSVECKKTSFDTNSLLDAICEIEAGCASSDPCELVSQEQPNDANDLTLQELKSINGQLKYSITCKLCLDTMVQEMFLPCRHFVCCEECGENVKNALFAEGRF